VEIIIDRIQIDPRDEATVYVASHAEHTEKGQTTSGAPTDGSCSSKAVLAAREALVAAVTAELTGTEDAKPIADRLPVVLAQVVAIDAAVMEATIDVVKG
jgi:hypothetical protein